LYGGTPLTRQDGRVDGSKLLLDEFSLAAEKQVACT
jgi:hypothetical protein